MNQNQDGNRRKTYAKPELRRIELKPEESLAAGCKTLSDMKVGASVPRACNIGSCFDIGS